LTKTNSRLLDVKSDTAPIPTTYLLIIIFIYYKLSGFLFLFFVFQVISSKVKKSENSMIRQNDYMLSNFSGSEYLNRD